MSPRFPYEPPPLNRRVTLRLASGEPTLNDFGQVTAAAVSTEARVWAHRYDRRGTEQTEAGAVIQKRYSTITIRYLVDVDEETVVVDGDTEYRVLGLPLERGGRGDGPAARYLELDCTAEE